MYLRKEFDETFAYTRLNDGLNLLVGAVTEIAERPASVREEIGVI